MTTVHIPYTVEQDETGVWCAHAHLTWPDGGRGGAFGQGDTKEAAIADLHDGLVAAVESLGVPNQAVAPMNVDVA